MISPRLTGFQSGPAYAASHAPLSNVSHPIRAFASISTSPATPGIHQHRRLRYRIIKKKPVGIAGIFPRRQRRDTVPLWTPAPNATEVPQLAPPISASRTFIKPQLGAMHGLAQRLLVDAYSEIFGCTPTEAEFILQQIDAALYEAWRDISHIGEIDWRPGEQPESPYAMAYGASSFALRLRDSPHLDDSKALEMARFHLTRHPKFSVEDEHRHILYQGVLERGLYWIDPNKARLRHLSSTEILQLAYHHRRPKMDSRAVLTEVLQRERSVLVDEAALIFFHTQTDSHDIEPNERIGIIRQHYANTLAREWLDASLKLRLLPSSPVGLNCYRFWLSRALTSA